MEPYYNVTGLEKLGNFVGDLLGRKSKETNALVALSNQPVTISPYVFIIPVAAVSVFGIIYLMVIRK